MRKLRCGYSPPGLSSACIGARFPIKGKIFIQDPVSKNNVFYLNWAGQGRARNINVVFVVDICKLHSK